MLAIGSLAGEGRRGSGQIRRAGGDPGRASSQARLGGSPKDYDDRS
jgi:hypothetical protein